MVEKVNKSTPSPDVAGLIDNVLKLMGHIEDVVGDDDWDKIDVNTWNAVTNSITSFSRLTPPKQDAPSPDVEGAEPVAYRWRMFAENGYTPFSWSYGPDIPAWDQDGSWEFDPLYSAAALAGVKP